MFKKILPLAAVFTLSVSALTFASTAEIKQGAINISSNTDKAQLVEGADRLKHSGITFGDLGTIDMDGDARQALDIPDFVRVDDNRGTNEGWQVSVSADPLTATVTDPTNGETIHISIPAQEVLKVTTSNLDTKDEIGSVTQYTTVTEGPQPVTDSGVVIMDAKKGSGAGIFTADLSYDLIMPKFVSENTTLTPSDSVSSEIDEKDKTSLGLFKGLYTTTVTYSVVTAPEAQL